MPDEIVWEFTEAVWRNMPWRTTRWLDRPVTSAPTDLLAYQEIIASVRPDWIVETGTGDGGRALFLASICDLVGHGQVVSIALDPTEDAPTHPRLQVVPGDPAADATVEAVRSLVGDGTAMVVLGSRRPRHETMHEFDAYAPLVPVGSYLVVADTIVNGHPVWPAFGPGPAEALKQIMNRHGEFVPDPELQKYSLTFNPGGFLRRVR